jgi:hypothetical protein
MKQREINLIFGKTGTGKSVFAKRYIESFERVIVVDAMLEYENGLIFENLNDLIDYISEHTPEKFTFICRFTSDLEIEYLFKLCWELENLLLVVEEAEIYIKPKAQSSNFLHLVRYGRHKSISILGIARRTAELSTNLRSQVNTIYSFKQTDKMDLKNMELLGFYDLENLQDYKFPERQIENRHYKKVEY